MADETLPTISTNPGTDQTGPLDAGHTTTEYALAKWTTIAGIVLAVLSSIVDVTNQIAQVIPGNVWVTKVGVVAGALVTILTSVLYGKQRADLKKAALNAGAAAPVTPGAASAAVRE